MDTFEGPFKGQASVNANWLPVQPTKVGVSILLYMSCLALESIRNDAVRFIYFAYRIFCAYFNIFFKALFLCVHVLYGCYLYVQTHLVLELFRVVFSEILALIE